MKYNGDLCYYITNLQGDVMSIVDAQGEVVAEYEYDPYGNIVSQSGPLAEVNPLRYRGYVFDSESGLYYLQSRYYDPEMGRFINADSYASTGQGILGNNMFAYCNNDPISHLDCTGRSPYDCIYAICKDGYSAPEPSLDERAKYIADNYTTITERTVRKNGITYITFDVSVNSDHFKDWSNDWVAMMEVNELYAYYVHELILNKVEISDGNAFWIMDENHIYCEMMAHVDVWFTFSVASTEEANLNVDEDRITVIPIMRLYGYTGSEEEIYR